MGWVEEAGGVDVIEGLQMHENEDVYRKANNIIEKWFKAADEGDDDSSVLAPAAGQYAYTFQATPAAPVSGFTF